MKNQAPWIFAATVGPLGYSRTAPGTVGSLPGLLLGTWLNYQFFQDSSYGSIFCLVSIFLGFTVFSLVAIHKTEQAWNTHDDSRIVIDEVLGQAITTAFIPLSPPWILASFACFRIFDIWKPWPISWIDQKMPGAWGTLLDDVLAGFFALLVIVLAKTYLF